MHIINKILKIIEIKFTIKNSCFPIHSKNKIQYLKPYKGINKSFDNILQKEVTKWNTAVHIWTVNTLTLVVV